MDMRMSNDCVITVLANASRFAWLLLGVLAFGAACGDTVRTEIVLDGIPLSIPKAYIVDTGDFPWIGLSEFNEQSVEYIRISIPIADLIEDSHPAAASDSLVYGSIRAESLNSQRRTQNELSRIAKMLTESFAIAEEIVAPDSVTVQPIFKVFREGRTQHVWHITTKSAPPFTSDNLVGICSTPQGESSVCELFVLQVGPIAFDGVISESALFAWRDIETELKKQMQNWISSSWDGDVSD